MSIQMTVPCARHVYLHQVAENTQQRIGDMQYMLDDCQRQTDAVTVMNMQLEALKNFRTHDLEPYRCIRGKYTEKSAQS